jgi:hypothetical protein
MGATSVLEQLMGCGDPKMTFLKPKFQFSRTFKQEG